MGADPCARAFTSKTSWFLLGHGRGGSVDVCGRERLGFLLASTRLDCSVRGRGKAVCYLHGSIFQCLKAEVLSFLSPVGCLKHPLHSVMLVRVLWELCAAQFCFLKHFRSSVLPSNWA